MVKDKTVLMARISK